MPMSLPDMVRQLQYIGDVLHPDIPSWIEQAQRGVNLARPILPGAPTTAQPTANVPPPAIPLWPRIAAKAMTGAQATTQVTPQQKYDAAVKAQQLQRGTQQAERAVPNRPKTPLATHVDLVQMGKDLGLSYERMVLALNGTQAAGMLSTPQNIKYWIAQMRQKGLFHPELEGGE
jgi:hypothetical protein